MAGTFRVGRVTGLDSMRAWLDEVKVFARDPGYEGVCNLGHGTLVRLDYGNPESPLFEHLPLDGTSVRADLTFPEGPLHAAQPRPAGSDSNPFCLGCHTTGQPPELGLQALLYDPSVSAQDDPRRQPMQTAPRIFGNVPMSYFSSGNAAFDAPANGQPVDPFVIP